MIEKEQTVTKSRDKSRNLINWNANLVGCFLFDRTSQTDQFVNRVYQLEG